MASEHYPADAGPSEEVRAVAAEILSDLRETPNGFGVGEMPCLEHAGKPTMHRAIAWLRECGIEVAFRRGPRRWQLAGNRRTLPAHALARVDLLDELRYLLGADRDPLEVLRDRSAGKWQTVHQWPLSISKREPGLLWRCDYHHHRIELLAYPIVDGEPVAGRELSVFAVSDFDVPNSAVSAYADFQIELHRASTLNFFADTEPRQRRASSW